MPSVVYWNDLGETITLTISQSAKDIIIISSKFIESYSAEFYPSATQIAEHVNKELPTGITVTIEDINIASTLLANANRTMFGEVNEAKTVSMLVSAFNDALSFRIVEKSSFIKDFGIIFFLVLGGYYLLVKERQRND
jgi:hypothetical protein